MIQVRDKRLEIDTIARSWIGTPFHDHARVKGAGVDCAQLLLAVYHEAGLIPAIDVGPYSAQFFLHQAEERYLGWVRRFAREIPPPPPVPSPACEGGTGWGIGDVALYRVGLCFSHAAIIAAPGWPHVIHAHAGGRIVRRGFGRSPHLGMAVKEIKFFSVFGAGDAQESAERSASNARHSDPPSAR